MLVSYTIDFEEFAPGDSIAEVNTPFGVVAFGPLRGGGLPIAFSSTLATSGSMVSSATWSSVSFPTGVVAFSSHFIDPQTQQLNSEGVLFPILAIEGSPRGTPGDYGCNFFEHGSCLFEFTDAVTLCNSASIYNGLDCSTAEYSGLIRNSFFDFALDDLALVAKVDDAPIPEPSSVVLAIVGGLVVAVATRRTAARRELKSRLAAAPAVARQGADEGSRSE